MRLPWDKIYRAFPELDPFSDEECERFVDRARAQRPISGLAALAGAAVFIVAFPLGLAVVRRLPQPGLPPDGPFELYAVLFILGTVGAGALAGLLVRDRLLIRAIRDRVTLARCPACHYSLLGLKVQTEGWETRVRCPECGAEHDLAAIGLTAADLIPRDPSQPVPSPPAVRAESAE